MVKKTSKSVVRRLVSLSLALVMALSLGVLFKQEVSAAVPAGYTKVNVTIDLSATPPDALTNPWYDPAGTGINIVDFSKGTNGDNLRLFAVNEDGSVGASIPLATEAFTNLQSRPFSFYVENASGNKMEFRFRTGGYWYVSVQDYLDITDWKGKEVNVNAKLLPIWSDNDGAYRGTIDFTYAEAAGEEPVLPINVSGVSLNQNSAELEIGGELALVATVSPENADDKSVVWSSNNESVATVVDGLVKAIAAGSATIKATTVDGGFVALCDITVAEEEPVIPDPEAPVFKLSTLKDKVKVGARFNVTASFDSLVESNIATLTVTYNTEKYQYVGFTPADGVSVLDVRQSAGIVRLTVSVADYATLVYGDFEFKAIAELDLTNPVEAPISIRADYVVRDSAKVKSIQNQTATLGISVSELIPGDVNDDGYVDLLDLSALLDVNGITNEDINWSDYSAFDCDYNGKIDNYDILNLCYRMDLNHIGVASDAVLTITPPTQKIGQGSYFTVDMAFDKPVDTNTYMLKLEYNTALFDYAGYSAAEGVSIIVWFINENSATLIFKNEGSALTNLGNLMFRAKDDADLSSEEDLAITVVMVEEIGGVKTITNTKGEVNLLKKSEGIFGDLNGDGKFDLIDLSDLIDAFGTIEGEDGWDLIKKYDLNESGEIDVFDIAILASFLN